MGPSGGRARSGSAPGTTPESDVVTVLTVDGDVIASLGVPGAGALLLDGPILYVAATTGGRIDAVDTRTLEPVDSYGAPASRPNTLVKAGGRLRTTTGARRFDVRLVSIDVATGVVAVYERSSGLGSVRTCSPARSIPTWCSASTSA